MKIYENQIKNQKHPQSVKGKESKKNWSTLEINQNSHIFILADVFFFVHYC